MLFTVEYFFKKEDFFMRKEEVDRLKEYRCKGPANRHRTNNDDGKQTVKSYHKAERHHTEMDSVRYLLGLVQKTG